MYEALLFGDQIASGSFWYKYIQNKLVAQCFVSYPVLSRNTSISSLILLGFRVAYNEFYSHGTMVSHLDSVRTQCNANSILCAGGGATNSDILELVSCGNCYSILTPTTIDVPVYVGSAYWYMASGRSFGFSPIYEIIQNSADTYDQSSPLRLSWHLNLNAGGWRLGANTGLDSSTLYKKYLLIKV